MTTTANPVIPRKYKARTCGTARMKRIATVALRWAAGAATATRTGPGVPV
jgi:hypothetical protein